MGKNRLDESFALFRAHCVECLEVVQELLVPMKKELVQKPARLVVLGVLVLLLRGRHCDRIVAAVAVAEAF